MPLPDDSEVRDFGYFVDIGKYTLELLILLLEVHPSQLKQFNLLFLAASLATSLNHRLSVLHTHQLHHIFPPQSLHFQLHCLVFSELNCELHSVVFLDGGSHFVHFVDFCIDLRFRWRRERDSAFGSRLLAEVGVEDFFCGLA